MILVSIAKTVLLLFFVLIILFIYNNNRQVDADKFPVDLDINRWRRRNSLYWLTLSFCPAVFILVLLYSSTDSIGVDLPTFLTWISVWILMVVAFNIFHSFLVGIFDKRLMILITNRLHYDGIPDTFDDNSFFVSFQSQRHQASLLNIEWGEDVGWLTFLTDKITIIGLSYRFEIDKKWVRKIKKERNWLVNTTLWGISNIRLTYVEPDGTEKFVRFIAKNGLTMLGYRAEHKRLWAKINQWVK